MNILVYGVHHWSNSTPSSEEISECKEWHDRIIKNIPNVKEVFISTGCYSDPEFSPLPPEVKIIQNKVPHTKPYSKHHNYFRNGLITGMWNALLNKDNWDILLHVQPRVLIGDNLHQVFKDFYKTEEMVLCPNFTAQYGTTMEISFFAMKPRIVMHYATSGLRPTFCTENTSTINCEDEAFLLFHNTWYNPWPEIITTRQIDSTTKGYGLKPQDSPFTILDEKQFNKLPFISTGKHVLQEYLQSWKKEHPL